MNDKQREQVLEHFAADLAERMRQTFGSWQGCSPNDYLKDAMRTEAPVEDWRNRLSNTTTQRLFHALAGISDEGGELWKQLKAHVVYGRALDTINIGEELGDLLWYIALAADACGFSLEELMEANIAKLKERFGDKFSEDEANQRDLDKERETLEEGLKDEPGQYKCPHCGIPFIQADLSSGLIPMHICDVSGIHGTCAGSLQSPRSINDKRPLWKDGGQEIV